MKRFVLLCACLLAAYPAAAGPIVTWQADGTVVRRSDRLVLPEPGVPIAPPVGTPLSLTLTFDPSSAVQTPFGDPGPLPGCKTVSVSGSVTIGGYTSPLSAGSNGYTQANLPGGSPCVNGSQTQFALWVPAAPDDNAFKLPAGLLMLSYHDLLVHDAFPNSPTPAFRPDVMYLESGPQGFNWVFDAQVDLSAVDQTTAVPEPSTLTLLGIGLLAAARARRRAADNEACASPQRPRRS